jgi:hypothetical protein
MSCGTLSGDEVNGYSALCSVTSAGTISPIFNFNSTVGNFYYRYYDPRGIAGSVPGCYGNNVPLHKSDATSPPQSYAAIIKAKRSVYTLNVPAQTIQYNLNVGETTSNNRPPDPPTITGPTTGLIETSYPFNFVSKDPDGDQIKYAISWTNDGTIEQYLPDTGLVDSGTSQSASSSWSALGMHTFEAMAIDSHDATSTWTTYNITLCSSTCGPPPTTNDFTITGSPITLSKTNPTATSTITIARDSNYTSDAFISPSIGTFSNGTFSNDISPSVKQLSSDCVLHTGTDHCDYYMAVTLNPNVSSPLPSYTIPLIGTRRSDSAVQNGSTIVTVTTTSCTPGTPGCPPGSVPTVSSCTIPGLPTGNVSSPYTLSLNGASATASGGSGGYTYSWSDDTTNFFSLTDFANIVTNLGASTYIYVKAKDSSGATSLSYPCGKITIGDTPPPGGPSIPELWPNVNKPNPNSINFIPDPLNSNNTIAVAVNSTSPITLTTHAYPGDSKTVSFAGSTLTNCAMITSLNGIVQTSDSDWVNILNGDSSSGSNQLQSLVQGVYKLKYSCQKSIAYTNSNPIMAALHNLFATTGNIETVYSNTIEIDVTPSTIREQ